MAGSVVTRRRDMKCKTKMKTGCSTCRPLCQKCVKTGRTCDGYDSPFRIFTGEPIKNAYASSIKSVVSSQPTSIRVTFQDIDLLSRHFSTKTLFNVNLGCDEEARQILQTSLTDPLVRHALLSLRALREDLETVGDGDASFAHQTSRHRYGLRQYTIALGGLASNLSSSGSSELKSALLCCQIFISIEQVRKNYSAMAQHIIKGLRIMHEYRARPYYDAANNLLPALHDQLPFLDVFIIKLFVAPCKFTDPPVTAEISDTPLSACPLASQQQPVGSRTIAPDMRTELTRIAALTLGFLDKVSRVETVETALRLVPEKATLLDSLGSWLNDLELVQTEYGPSGPEPISVSFLRIFHIILKIVLLGALDSPPDLYADLRDESDRLQALANEVDGRVRTYITCSGSNGNREEISTMSD
ncbi:conserved hypothetical protein [Talaromyces stipitatus ATCC 10500]|uniref:Zn(2)-C6 fungal-type domain-containing protein n=1 Tax=Talaromyces stipitatus (strain ATCC 10500 / CBS 375.48 / QM 6759 / NRRL 1006) TaxID=441959 RepID=B8M9S0_TALSN|nr:uncharacterized protein TSTA_118410 [Talaromyces stipitatus ATCC 10500]EED18072.1 conserved hypothetical protein [Talaromyces stipitatus ATCC 10500]